MNVTMVTEEVCDLLGVDKNGLRAIIKRGRLEHRFRQNGYKLINILKDGRINIYELEYIKNEWERYQNANNICKKEEHTKYTEHRLTDGLKSPRVKAIEDSNADISISTARRYDNLLIEDFAMEKDTTVYFIKNTLTGEWREVTRDEYTLFWSRCRTAKYHLNMNYIRFKKGEISRAQYEDTSYLIKDNIANEQGEIAFKFDTYKEAQNTKVILDMINSCK